MRRLIKVGSIGKTTRPGTALLGLVGLRQYAFQAGAMAVFLVVHPAAVQAGSGAGVVGTGRLLPTIAVLLGLTGVVIGWRALVNSGGAGNGRSKAIIAMILGLIGLFTGLLHATNAAGGPGTGNGLVGAYVAMVLGLVNVAIGALALARSKRITNGIPRERT